MRRLLLIALLLLSGCDWFNKHRQPDDQPRSGPGGTLETPPADVLDSGDRVQELLRDRVRSKFQTGDDFQVLVTGVGYPIGTLMEEGRTVAKTQSACHPTFEVGKFSLPNMFNAIIMRGKAAFDLGLDSAAVAGLAKFGVKAGQDDVFNLSVGGTKGQFLLDQELQDLLSQQGCTDYLKGKTLLLVRGYVSGIRNYQLQRDTNAGAEINVASVGGLKVETLGTSGVTLKDEEPAEFLQIVSKVSVPGPPPPPPPAPVLLPPFTGPQPIAGLGPVYVQRDKADASGNATRILDLLSEQRFKVAYEVEAIPSDKMPKIAQVRYFSADDEPVADKALALLRQVYPSAAKLLVGLKAPKGQLEVWLPRAGLPPGRAAAAVPGRRPGAAARAERVP